MTDFEKTYQNYNPRQAALDEARALLTAAAKAAMADGTLPEAELPAFIVEIPADVKNGDIASNLAMAGARTWRKAPKMIADALLAHLPSLEDSVFSKVEVAGPGFINLFLSQSFWAGVVLGACANKEYLFHHALGHLDFPRARLLERAHVRASAKHDHFKSGIGERKAVALGNIGNGFPDIRRLHLRDVLPVQQGLPAFPRQKTDHAFEQRRFTDAIRAENRKNVSFFQTEVDVVENHRLSEIAEAAVFDFKDHRKLLLFLLRRVMKTGAPMMAVRMESGSSMMLMVRESVSIRIMKLAPRLRLTGMTYRLLLPTSMRAQCGMSRPIQPT